MFTGLFQGEVLILLDFLVNGDLKNDWEADVLPLNYARTWYQHSEAQ